MRTLPTVPQRDILNLLTSRNMSFRVDHVKCGGMFCTKTRVVAAESVFLPLRLPVLLLSLRGLCNLLVFVEVGFDEVGYEGDEVAFSRSALVWEDGEDGEDDCGDIDQSESNGVSFGSDGV